MNMKQWMRQYHRLYRLCGLVVTVLAIGLALSLLKGSQPPIAQAADPYEGFTPFSFSLYCRNYFIAWGMKLESIKVRMVSPDAKGENYTEYGTPNGGTYYTAIGVVDANPGAYNESAYITKVDANKNPLAPELFVKTQPVKACADIAATSLTTSKKVYHVGETISATIALKNNSTTAIESQPGVTTTLSYGNGQGTTFTDSAGFGGNQSRNYTKTWTVSTPKIYQASSHTDDIRFRFAPGGMYPYLDTIGWPPPGNYWDKLAEENLANNNISGAYYAVIVPPKNFTASASCRSATLKWTAGQAISQYQLAVKDSGGSLVAPIQTISGTAIGATLSNLPTNKGVLHYTLTPIVLINGVPVKDIEITGASFTPDGCIDLSSVSYSLADSSGKTRRIFATSESIFFTSTVRNNSSVSAAAGVDSRFYKDNNAYYPNYPDSTIVHGAWGPGSQFSYASYPGGVYESEFSKKSVNWSGTGQHQAMFRINRAEDSGPVHETNYSNNVRSYDYAMIKMPTNLQVAAKCKSAVFSWSGGEGIEQYQIKITNTTTGGSDTYSNIPGGNTSLQRDLAEGPNDYTWQLIPQVTINGTLVSYDGPIKTNSFATPSCPKFEVKNPTQINVVPGESGEGQFTISFINEEAWKNLDTGRALLTFASIVKKGQACSTVSGFTSAFGLTPTFNVGYADKTQGWYDFDPSGSVQKSVTVSSTISAPIGEYTLCLNARGWQKGGAAAEAEVIALTPTFQMTIKVARLAWLQVGQHPGVGNGTGDIYSNWPFGLRVPADKYLFSQGVAGVVISAASSLSSVPAQRTADVPTRRWRVENYFSHVQQPEDGVLNTTTFASFAKQVDRLTVGRKTSIQTAALRNGSPTSNPGKIADAGCTPGRSYDAVKIVPDSGSEVVWDGGRINASTFCPMIMQIGPDADGNPVDFVINVSSKPTKTQDPTGARPLIYLVSGSVKISCETKALNNMMLIWNQGFDDAYDKDSRCGGEATTQLIVQGSLIALPGSWGFSPVSDGSVPGLRRNDPTTDEPGEIVQYNPEIIYNLSEIFSGNSTVWWTEAR